MGLERLVLVRHGETTRNVVEVQKSNEFFFKDSADRDKALACPDFEISLTNKGVEQALETGEALRECFGNFHRVLTSPYDRSVKTVTGIASAYGKEEYARMVKEMRTNILIREREPGYAFNMTEEEVNKFFPWFREYYKNSDPFSRVPPGGESILRMCSGRLRCFLQELKEESLSSGIIERVLVVSHCRTILGLRAILENWSYAEVNRQMKEEEYPNCGVTSYIFYSPDHCCLEFANKVFWSRPLS